MNTFSPSDFIALLNSGKGFPLPPVSVDGFVRPSKEPGIISFAPGTNCQVWISIPEQMVDKVEHMGKWECRDHELDYVKIYFILPVSSEAKVFANLFEQQQLQNQDLLEQQQPQKQEYTTAGTDAMERPAAAGLLGTGTTFEGIVSRISPDRTSTLIKLKKPSPLGPIDHSYTDYYEVKTGTPNDSLKLSLVHPNYASIFSLLMASAVNNLPLLIGAEPSDGDIIHVIFAFPWTKR
jgi:hypothetical protein